MPALVAGVAAMIAVGARAEDGGAVYAVNCAMCHQADGQGAAGVAPPLAGTLIRYEGSEAGRRYLAQIAVSGMAGAIRTETGKFRGAMMPSFLGRLDDAAIAAAMNYVLSQWNTPEGGAAPVLTADEVARAREATPGPGETHALRETLWSGP